MFEIELDELEQLGNETTEVLKSDSESSGDATQKSADTSALRLADFIQNYKKKLAINDKSKLNLKYVRAINSYTRLDQEDYASTQLAVHLKKVA